MLCTFLDQPPTGAGPSLLRLDVRGHHRMAADIFGRNTPRLPFSIVLTEACGAQSDEALRQLLDALVATTSADEMQPLLAAQLSEEQLANCQILLTGKHIIEDGFVVAGGNAVVEVSGHGIALAFGDASVTARGEYEVYATGEVTLHAYDKSRLDLSGNVRVKAFDYVQGVARGNVRGTVRGNSTWQVENEANFDAYDRAQVNGTDQCVLRGFGNSRINGLGSTQAYLFERAEGWFDDDAVIEIHGTTTIYKTDSVRIARETGTPRKLLWQR